MKRNLITGAVVLTAAIWLSPAAVGATDDTTGQDSESTTVTIPDECISPSAPVGDPGAPGRDWPPDVGPARVAHRVSVSGADCSEIEGICVVLVKGPPGNPGPDATPPPTMLRGIKAGLDVPQDEVAIDPCAGVDDACVITMVGEQGPDGPAGSVTTFPPGPGRAAHSRPSFPAEVWVEIPQACQDVLSGLAIPTTGSDSTNILWIGVVLVSLGGVLLTTRRVATVR